MVRVLTVCGMGFGTSLMMLMTLQEIGKKHGIEITGEAVDLGSYKGKPCDVIVASSEIAKGIEADIPVIAIEDLLNKKKIEEQFLSFMENK